MINYTKGEWKLLHWTVTTFTIELNSEVALRGVLTKPLLKQEVEANAQLIASAPKQNEALQEVERFLREELPHFSGDLDDKVEELQIVVGQALAKAEGKE